MIQQFFPDEDVNHFHSSGYAEAAHGRTIGAASAQSYRARLQVERNRKHVSHYKHSLLGRPATEFRPQGESQASVGTERDRLNTGQSRPSGVIAPRPQAFREPPARGYNPYQ